MPSSDQEFINSILSIPAETDIIECKRISGEEKIVQKVLKSIVAMTNTHGGIIILWLDDPEKSKLKWNDRIFWIEEFPENYDEIMRLLKNISPNIFISPMEVFDEVSKKTLVLLKIPKSEDHLRTINNEVRIRLKKWNKKLETPQDIIKYSYAKWFLKADHELVDVDFDLLDTTYFQSWKQVRWIQEPDIKKTLLQTGLARKNDQWLLYPTRAAVLLFAQYPTNLMDTKCTIRVYQYTWTFENFLDVPNLIWTPKTIDGPIIKCIYDAHEYVLLLLRSWIKMPWSWFMTSYKIPERAVKEAITNAVIHRDYNIKRDIEVYIFEDRIEIISPGLLPYNITPKNIWYVRSEYYRNDIIVKHLREFPTPPNLDRNEWVQAMRNEMKASWLYPPIYITYPTLPDVVKVVLLNEAAPSERDKISHYLQEHSYIDNETARWVAWVQDTNKMSEKFKTWLKNDFYKEYQKILISRSLWNINYCHEIHEM